MLFNNEESVWCFFLNELEGPQLLSVFYQKSLALGGGEQIEDLWSGLFIAKMKIVVQIKQTLPHNWY